MRRYYGVVRWQPIDVHRLRPSWTKKQCARALAHWEGQLEEAMIREGWRVLEDMIGIEDQDFYSDYCGDLRWDDMPESPEKAKDATDRNTEIEGRQAWIPTGLPLLPETNDAKRRLGRDPELLGVRFIELACRLGGVPDGSRPPTREQIRAEILDLAAARAGIPRDELETMPREDRLRVVVAQMHEDIWELGRLLTDRWCNRIAGHVDALVNAGLCSGEAALRHREALLARTVRTLERDSRRKPSMRCEGREIPPSNESGGKKDG